MGAVLAFAPRAVRRMPDPRLLPCNRRAFRLGMLAARDDADLPPFNEMQDRAFRAGWACARGIGRRPIVELQPRTPWLIRKLRSL